MMSKPVTRSRSLAVFGTKIRPIISRTDNENFSTYGILCDAARSSLEANSDCEETVRSVEAGFALILHKNSLTREFTLIELELLDSDDHTEQYPSHSMFEAS